LNVETPTFDDGRVALSDIEGLYPDFGDPRSVNFLGEGVV
jgi:hypothetical protein